MFWMQKIRIFIFAFLKSFSVYVVQVIRVKTNEVYDLNINLVSLDNELHSYLFGFNLGMYAADQL